jgi:hypothetical protein
VCCFTIKIVSCYFSRFFSVAHWFFTEPGFTVEDNDDEHVSAKESHSSDEDDNKSDDAN